MEDSAKRRVYADQLREIGVPDAAIEEAVRAERAGLFNMEPSPDLLERTIKRCREISATRVVRANSFWRQVKDLVAVVLPFGGLVVIMALWSAEASRSGVVLASDAIERYYRHLSITEFTGSLLLLIAMSCLGLFILNVLRIEIPSFNAFGFRRPGMILGSVIVAIACSIGLIRVNRATDRIEVAKTAKMQLLQIVVDDMKESNFFKQCPRRRAGLTAGEVFVRADFCDSAEARYVVTLGDNEPLSDDKKKLKDWTAKVQRSQGEITWIRAAALLETRSSVTQLLVRISRRLFGEQPSVTWALTPGEALEVSRDKVVILDVGGKLRTYIPEKSAQLPKPGDRVAVEVVESVAPRALFWSLEHKI